MQCDVKGTAISINVVGKRHQAYATRPKGSMGRNVNSIVGWLAMASESMKVCLRVLKKGNKSRYDTYSVKDVPLFIVLVISTHTPFRFGRVCLTPLTDNVY